MRLASRPDAHAATNPYRVWIAEYAGAPYQEVAARARAHLEGLADLYVTPAREAELIVIFKEATRLEADLEALFTGGNPFDETEPVTDNGDAEVNPDDVPF